MLQRWVWASGDHPRMQVEQRNGTIHQVVALLGPLPKNNGGLPQSPAMGTPFTWFRSLPPSTHLLDPRAIPWWLWLGTGAKRLVSDRTKVGRSVLETLQPVSHWAQVAVASQARLRAVVAAQRLARAKGMENTPKHSLPQPVKSRPFEVPCVCHLCFDRWERWRRTGERWLNPLICLILLNTLEYIHVQSCTHIHTICIEYVLIPGMSYCFTSVQCIRTVYTMFYTLKEIYMVYTRILKWETNSIPTARTEGSDGEPNKL